MTDTKYTKLRRRNLSPSKRTSPDQRVTPPDLTSISEEDSQKITALFLELLEEGIAETEKEWNLLGISI